MLTTKLRTESAAIAQSAASGNATAELYQHLEYQVHSVAPNSTFNYINIENRGFAQKTAIDIEQAARTELEKQLEIGRNLLEAKKVLTRRKEFSNFRDSLSLTPAEARKRLKLALVFGDWDIERLLKISGATSLLALCQSKYVEVVSRLREVPEITKELVLRLIKQVRTAHAKPKPKAQLPNYGDAVLEKHVDEESGTFYYTLKEVNLSDRVGSALAAKLETHTIGQVLAAAVEIRDDYATNQLQELHCAIADVQRLSTENHSSEVSVKERDEIIAELEARSACSIPFQENNDQKTPNTHFSTWEEVATKFECDRLQLLSAVKNWTTTERQRLSKLLSEFLETSPEGLEQAAWVPENLLKSALHYLFFTVQRITASSNLIDDPHVEQVPECRLISVRDFGTRREHWVFRSPDGKQFPVYGRREFSMTKPLSSQSSRLLGQLSVEGEGLKGKG